MISKTSRLLSAALIVLTSLTLSGCDREDRRDLEEGVNEVDRQVDQLDSDGRDD